MNFLPFAATAVFLSIGSARGGRPLHRVARSPRRVGVLAVELLGRVDDLLALGGHGRLPFDRVRGRWRTLSPSSGGDAPRRSRSAGVGAAGMDAAGIGGAGVG